MAADAGEGPRIYRVPVNGGAPEQLTEQPSSTAQWSPDLTTGEKRQLTKLKPGYSVRGFDISPDSKEILYDRAQENSERRATEGELKSAAHKRFRR